VAQFDLEEPSDCPQCGNQATFVYHRNEPGFVQCTSVAGVLGGKPHMHRFCTVCQYQWAEEPVV